MMLCFIAGVGVRSFVPVDDFWIFLGFGLFAVSVIAFSGNPRAIVYAAFALVSLCGVLWYGRFEPSYFVLEPLTGQRVELEANIVADPEFKNGIQRLTVQVSEAPGERVTVTARRYPEFAYGDTVRVSGALKKPENFNGFDYARYLAKDGIYFTMDFAQVALAKEGENGFMRRIFALKKRFEENVSAVLVFPHSAFVNGILLGSDGEIPKELKDAFIATGTSHVLALSGYNITVIIMFVGLLLSSFFVSRHLILYFSIAVIIAFVTMTGASPSVVRAAVMGVALITARQLGRQGSALNMLVFAGFAMILFNPKILMFDISFQLSFLAVLGLAYIFPYLQEKMKKVPEFLKLKESFITTMSAQIAVLPLVLYDFHRFSLAAPVANMLIIPFIPFAMLFGFLAGVAEFASHMLASALAYPLWAIVAYQLAVVKYFAAIPYSVFAF